MQEWASRLSFLLLLASSHCAGKSTSNAYANSTPYLDAHIMWLSFLCRWASFRFVPLPGLIPDRHPSCMCASRFLSSLMPALLKIIFPADWALFHLASNLLMFLIRTSGLGVSLVLFTPWSVRSLKTIRKSSTHSCLNGCLLGILSETCLTAWKRHRYTFKLSPNTPWRSLRHAQQLSMQNSVTRLPCFTKQSCRAVSKLAILAKATPGVRHHVTIWPRWFITQNNDPYWVTHRLSKFLDRPILIFPEIKKSNPPCWYGNYSLSSEQWSKLLNVYTQIITS